LFPHLEGYMDNHSVPFPPTPASSGLHIAQKLINLMRASAGPFCSVVLIGSSIHQSRFPCRQPPPLSLEVFAGDPTFPYDDSCWTTLSPPPSGISAASSGNIKTPCASISGRKETLFFPSVPFRSASSLRTVVIPYLKETEF